MERRCRGTRTGRTGRTGFRGGGSGGSGGTGPEQRALCLVTGLQLPEPHSLALRTVPSPPEALELLPNDPFIDPMGQKPTLETTLMLDEGQAYRLPRA